MVIDVVIDEYQKFREFMDGLEIDIDDEEFNEKCSCLRELGYAPEEYLPTYFVLIANGEHEVAEEFYRDLIKNPAKNQNITKEDIKKGIERICEALDKYIEKNK